MAFFIKKASGYSGSSVLYAGGDEIAYVCGNTLVLQHLVIGSQRILRGTSFGIQAFAVNKKHGLVAVAEKGPNPAVHVYSMFEMQRLATIQLGYEFGYAALAFSADGERLAICGEEPDTQLVVYMWRKGEVLVSAPLPQGVTTVHSISFHPYHADMLATTSPGSSTRMWHVERLWDKHVLKSTCCELPPHPSGSEDTPTTHCWYPHGLYVGTSLGRVLALDTLTLQPHPTTTRPGITEAQGSPDTQLAEEAESEPNALLAEVVGQQDSQSGSRLLDAALGSLGHGPVSVLSVNRDLLVVGGADVVRWYTHEFSGHEAHLYCEAELGPGASAVGMDMGGQDHLSIVVGVSDGRVLMFEVEAVPYDWTAVARASPVPEESVPEESREYVYNDPYAVEGEHVAAPPIMEGRRRSPLPAVVPTLFTIVESHVGAVTAMAPFPARNNSMSLSIGVDGTLRVWSGHTGQVVARRAFGSALTALAVTPLGAPPLAAVGSETGVVRLVWLGGLTDPGTHKEIGGEAASRELQVTWRCRLQHTPIRHATFSPDGTMLAVAGQSGLWFMTLDSSGGARVLGQVQCPEAVVGLVWPEVQDVEDSVLASLASGAIMCATAPIALAAASRPSREPNMVLTSQDLSIKVVKTEAALSSIQSLAGDKYGDVLGVGADKMLHKVTLPTDLPAWTGIRGRTLKSVNRVPVHARPEGVIALAPSRQLIVSGASDGMVAIHTLSFYTVGRLRPADLGQRGPAGSERDSRRGSVSQTPSPLLPAAPSTPAADSGRDGEAEGGAGAAGGSLAAFSGGARVGLHDPTVGGVTAITFDHSSKFVMSAGADGSVFVYETQGTGHMTKDEGQALMYGRAASAPKIHASVLRTLGDQDVWDDAEQEPAITDTHRPAAAPAGARPTAAASLHETSGRGAAATLERLEGLKAALLRATAENDAAPDLEKVPRNDFLIDKALAAELAAAADAKVAAAREEVRRAQVEVEVVAERVRTMCWDSLEQTGESISGMRVPDLFVPNFPMAKSEHAPKRLAKLAFLRRMEAVERRGGLSMLANPQGSAHAHSLQADSSSGVLPSQGTPRQPTSTAAAGEEDQGDDLAASGALGAMLAANAPIDALLYADNELHCPGRKAMQLHFLAQKVRDLCAGFNADWAKLQKQKRADGDKIADLNTRMEDVCKDLDKLGVAHPSLQELCFHVPWPEDMAAVLTVTDEEVGAERYESGDAREAKERAAAAAATGGGGTATDANAAERALRQMMGGTLAARETGEDQWTLQRPEWMEGNPKMFSDEQMKELREFQAKEKALAEEKAQRVTQLEQELRTLRQGVDETVAKFDDALVSLAAKHAAVAARIVAAESRMIGLVGAVDGVRRASDRIEAATLDKFGVRKEQQQRVGVELGEKRSLLAQLEARMAEVQGEERVLDRGFKKEFHDAERRYSDLLHLYKTRKEAVASPSPSPPPHAHHRSDQGEDRGHGGRARPSNTNRHSDSNQSVISHSTVGVARGSRAHDNTRHSMADGAAPTGAPPTVAGSVRVEGEGGSAAPPVHPLEAVLQHPYIKEAMANTQEPFPALPPAVANLIPSALMEFGDLPEGVQEEPEELADVWKPEGLEPEIWHRFQEYRGKKVRLEAEARRLAAKLGVLRREVPALAAEEAAHAAAAEEAMAELTGVKMARRAALYDMTLQLRLKAGQVEAREEPPAEGAVGGGGDARRVFVGAGLGDDAAMVHRSVVEGVNGVVVQQGTKLVTILTAIKDFRKGIYALEWEHKRCDMLIADLTERVRELQLLHVTRDMQAVFKEGADKAASAGSGAVQAEIAALEALQRQRERLHIKNVAERQRNMRVLASKIGERSYENAEVDDHLVGLSKVLEEQQRLRASMGSSDEAAARRMRSLVTHKRLKEIALAQADEVRALAAELDRLRLRTYPTFLEPTPTMLPADTRTLAGGFGSTPGSPGRMVLPKLQTSLSPQRQPRGTGSGSRRGGLSKEGSSATSGVNLLPLQRSHPTLGA